MVGRVVLRLLAALAIPLVSAAPVRAQRTTGTIAGRIADASGRPAAAVVRVTSHGADRRQTADAAGRFVFADVAAGEYHVAIHVASAASPASLRLRVDPNRTTAIVATVRGGIVDVRATTASTNITSEQIERLPTGRSFVDYAALAPGVLTNDPPTGFSPRGLRQTAALRGTDASQVGLRIDGFDVADPGSGAELPPFRPSIGAIERVEVLHGGPSAEYGRSSGLSMNVLTRSGTDTFLGGVPLRITGGGLTGGPDDDDDPAFDGTTLGSAFDVGGYLGGPIRQWDKTFFFGDVNLFGAGRTGFSAREDAIRDTSEKWGFGKLNTEWRGIRLFGIGLQSRTTEDGAGSQAFFAPDATWKYGRNFNLYGGGLDATRGQLTLGLRLSYRNADHGLDPQGGTEAVPTFTTENILTGTNYQVSTDRGGVGFEGRVGLATEFAGWSHKISGGVGWLRWSNRERLEYPQGQFVFHLGGDDYVAGLPVGFDTGARVESGNYWIEDVLQKNDLTLSLGLNLHRQRGSILPSFTIANPEHNSLVEREFTLDEPVISTFDIGPRLGFAWTPLTDKTTIVRGGYGVYYDRMTFGVVSQANPLANDPIRGAIGQPFSDWTGDGRLGPGDWLTGLPGVVGGIPVSSDQFTQPWNTIADEFASPKMQHVYAGFSASIPAFSYEVAFDARSWSNLWTAFPKVREQLTFRAATRDDYVPGTPFSGMLPDGTPFTIDTFRYRNGVTSTAATELSTVPDLGRAAWQLAFIASRLCDGGFLGGSIAFGRDRWSRAADVFSGDPNPLSGLPLEGGPAGARPADQQQQDVIMNSGVDYRVWGAKQFKGIDWSFVMHGQQGYVLPFTAALTGGDGVSRDVRVGEQRLDDWFTVNAGAAKNLTFGRRTLRVSAEAFNLFNRQSIAGVEHNVGAAGFGETTRFTPPRQFVLGARLMF